jgi:hypothetical protein
VLNPQIYSPHFTPMTPVALVTILGLFSVFTLSYEMVVADEGAASTRRRLKSESDVPRYLRFPRETCLLTGYVVKGTSEEQTGDTFTRLTNGCSSLTGRPFDVCLLRSYLGTAFSAPFQYALNGANATLQFTTDESLLGDGSLLGSIPNDSTDRFDKVILTYISSPYIQGVNNELWNRPVSDFEYIEYSFKVGACSGVETSCPEQFYLNVYTRPDASVTDFYSCRYDFVPSVGGTVGDDWTTLRFDISTTADDAVSRRDTAGCPPGDKTLQNAADNNYVLGTNEQYPSNTGQIFSLNMGDTSLNDVGLVGYFDAIVVKMKDEDAYVFDLEP